MTAVISAVNSTWCDAYGLPPLHRREAIKIIPDTVTKWLQRQNGSVLHALAASGVAESNNKNPSHGYLIHAALAGGRAAYFGSAPPRKCNALQYKTIQCHNTIQYNIIQYSTMQCIEIQCNAVQCITIQYNTVQYNTRQYNTTQYNTTQRTALQGYAMQFSAMQCNAGQYNAMRYTPRQNLTKLYKMV